MNYKKILVFLLITFLLLTACTKKEEVKKEKVVKDDNFKVITVVLTSEFTAPNEELKNLKSEIDKKVIKNILEKDEAVLEEDEAVLVNHRTFVENTYAPYFTKSGLHTFIDSRPAFRYHNYVNEYTLAVDDIKIKKSEDKKHYYTFTFTALFTDKNKEEFNFSFKGHALFSKDGKIKEIDIIDLDNINTKVYSDIHPESS